MGIPTSAVLLGIAALFMVDWDGFNLGAVAYFTVIGLVFPVGATILTFEANRGIGPNATAALGNLAPMFAVLFAAIVLAEAPSDVQCLGIAVQPVIKAGYLIWAEPVAAALFGTLASSFVIVGLLRLREGHMMPMMDRRGIFWFAAVGITNGIGVLAMYAALASGPVIRVAPLVASYPLATLGFTIAFGGTAGPGLRAVIGVGATVAGVAILLLAVAA